MNFTITGHEVWAQAGTRLPAIKEYAHKQLMALWRACIREFVAELLDDLARHVDTGMSIASLRPLSKILTVGNVRLANIGGLRSLTLANIEGTPKPGHRKLYGEWANNNAPLKSAALGETLGQDAYTISFGSPGTPDLEFTFRIVVFQHFLNEFGYGSLPAFDSLEKGREAFLAYWDQNLESYISAKYILDILLGNTDG